MHAASSLPLSLKSNWSFSSSNAKFKRFTAFLFGHFVLSSKAFLKGVDVIIFDDLDLFPLFFPLYPLGLGRRSVAEILGPACRLSSLFRRFSYSFSSGILFCPLDDEASPFSTSSEGFCNCLSVTNEGEKSSEGFSNCLSVTNEGKKSSSPKT